MFESFELSALLISIIAGLFLGIPSGPALFFVLDTTVQAGRTAAIKVYGGLMASKLIWILLALLANDFISRHQKIEAIFYLMASLLLVGWGFLILFKKKSKKSSSNETTLGSFYRTGFIVGISNPVIPFIYLTFIQFIKIYASDPGILKYLLNIAIMEAVSFLVLAGMAIILMKGGKLVQQHWQKLVKVMGILLICVGTYQAYQMIDYHNGEFGIHTKESPLEEQLENVEEISR